MKKTKIIFVHLFNNYSGSPKVLLQIINGLIDSKYEIELIVNKTNGFLSNIDGVKYNLISYNWHRNKIITLTHYFFSQFQIFFKIIFKGSAKDKIIYINTITPIGAAIACQLINAKCIFHVHEKYSNSNFIHKLCEYIYLNTKGESIFVSRYLQNSYKEKSNKGIVIYNALDKNYREIAKKNLEERKVKSETILMVCSLRDFKGIYEFVKLSKILPNYKFELVLSASKKEVNAFIREVEPLVNLKIFSNQTNLHPFYQRAKLLLNLSNPEKWIETFGLTILEAMAYGVPAIAPNIGGPVELIENGINGYLINPTDILQIKKHIELLLTDTELHCNFSKNAIQKSNNFDAVIMEKEINKLIKSLL